MHNLQGPLAFVPKEVIRSVALGESPGTSLFGTSCLEKCWHQPTSLVRTCRMKGELCVYLNSTSTTAWSIWKGLSHLWNALYFLCLKVGDKIPADLLRAEVASGLMLLKKRPHFWPQLHRNDLPACDLSPVLTRSSTYWFELPSRIYI